ncbi:hypothetical protein [Companilactobacillus sp. DQM5]|uniref:hypothetical protein n=1 Tax=Companilactobacillus sp. DQM5 TaxID=3463359 RepID=UPI004058C9A3
MANSSSPTPTVDGNALKWEITAPSIQEQMNNSSFLEKDLSLKLKVKDDKNNVFKDATNTLKITKATFNDGEDFLPNSIDGKITISQSDADKLPPQTGSYYNPEHFGPKDGEGNLAGVKEYVDPQVTDDATLAFGMRVSSMYTNSQEEDLKAYTVHYKVDPNLKIKKFYSGDFNMSTGKGGVVGKPLKNLSHYSFNVRYTDDSDDVPSKISGTEVVNPITGDPVIYQDAHKNNWHTLVADVPLGKWLTAKDLNIPENKTIKEIMLHFHPAKGTVRHDIFNKDKTYIATGDENGLPDYYEADPTGYYGQQGSDLSYLENWAPAGMYSNNVDFKMGIKKGYIGQVKNSMYINNYGTTAKGKGFWLGSEYEWNDKYSAMIAGAQAQTAEVVKAVTGINRVLKTSVAFDYLSELPDGQKVLSPGENSVTTSIDNTQTSKNSAPGPMISYVLLPKSVQYIGDIDGTNGKVSQLLSDNYQGSGQSLVKVNYSSDNIQPNKNISQQFKVNVTDGVSTDPEIKVYSFIGSDDFSVPDIKGTPVITDTKKDVDKDNLNGNGTDKPMFYSGRDYHFDKANALSVSETVEKQAETVKKVAGDKVNYQLQLTNTSEDDLNNMILMDTLPSVGDLSITTNEDRGSQFDMSLTGPINIPKSWEDKVNVEYTTSSNPKKSGILDKDTIYPSTAQKLEDAQGAEDATWVSAKDVTDWTKIKAFKIELKDKTTWVSGADMAINFGMKVPEDAEAKTTAYNSFAFASNASQVIEPYRLGVEIKDPVGPKQIPTLPVKPNQPGNKDNPGSNTEDNNNSKTDKGSNNGNRGTNVSNYNNLPRTGENIRNTSILTIVGLLLITVTEYFVIKNKKNRNI